MVGLVWSSCQIGSGIPYNEIAIDGISSATWPWHREPILLCHGLEGDYKEHRKNGQSTWEAMESLGLSEDEMNEFDR